MAEARTEMQLVVVGSSAGGIEALGTLVSTLPLDFPTPVVIAQHISPSHPSHLETILARRTPLAVRTLAGTETLLPGTVYVVPENHHVEVRDGQVRVFEYDGKGPRPSVDHLLESAAASYGEGLIAVILTGNGSDGAAGARAVSEAGGTVVVQNPDTASFPSMPLSLSPTTIDVVANVENIGAVLADLAAGLSPSPPLTEGPRLRVFLENLREQSGVDFTNYKMPTILRRLQRRMVATGMERLPDYIRYLQEHPEEYQRLVSSFLIKVTEFFRDAELYTALRERILPELIAQARGRDHELRFWSAGTATGEEAYSLAILVAELLGDELDAFTVRIFATDLDNEAITFARRGVYPAAALVNVPPALVERYFTVLDDEYEVKKRVCGLTVFGQHDLAQRAPFPRLDLTLCRNVLIYFTPELQRRALQLFAFSLRDGGYLVLGKAETVTAFAEYFVPEIAQLKVFRRQGSRVLMPPARPWDPHPIPPIAAPRPSAALRLRPSPDVARVQREAQRARTQREQMEELVLTVPIGIATVDRRYDVRIINNAARRLLGIHTQAIDEDLVHLARNIPSDALRAAIDGAFRGEPTTMEDVAVMELLDGETHYLRIVCYPQRPEQETAPIAGVIVTVTDATATALERRSLDAALTQQRAETERATAALQRLSATNRELLAANEALNTSNAELRSANEEFLVANEESQAAAEEIETLNEELQATNEELETLNEELQATVEELNTTNDDLQARGMELQDLAISLEEQRRESEAERQRLAIILVSMGDAVLLIAPDGTITDTNAAYARMFGGPDATFVAQDDDGDPLPEDVTPQARAARGESFRMEFTLTAADGTRRWFEANGQPVDGDARVGGVLTIRDVSERSLRRMQDEFMAMASHELRTPLTVLSGYMQLIVRQPDTTGRARRYANLALEQVERLLRLVNELLDVSRLRTGQLGLTLAPVALNPVIARVVETTRMMARGQEIVPDMRPETLWINGDAGRIEQVLLNLITNAIIYAPDTRQIEVALCREDDAAEITVADHGPGIPPEDLPYLFTRFYQARHAHRVPHQGLGLGLFISREIVQGHGGTIAAESPDGNGTRFTVRLPLIPPPETTGAAPA